MFHKEITKGVKISSLGLGTWGIGGKQTADYTKDEEAISALQTGIELGMTHIDTAEYYGAGHCEEIVGSAIEPYRRKNLFITSKVWHNHLKYKDLIQSIRNSLTRLRQDYIDLYLVHWPNLQVPLKETMKALEFCTEEGYTRFIGVSNFSTQLLEEAQTHLKEQKLVVNQVKFSLEEQKPREELLPYCQRNDVTVIAYTPLAKGRLAQPGNPLIDELVEKYNKSPAQISLNWLISQDKVISIPKASTPEHLKDNLGSMGWTMKKEDQLRLARPFR